MGDGDMGALDLNLATHGVIGIVNPIAACVLLPSHFAKGSVAAVRMHMLAEI